MNFDRNDPIQAALIEKRQSNIDRLAILERQGFQLTIGGRESAILELLLDAVLGASPERIAFENEQADNIATLIDDAEGKIRQQVLTAGVAQIGPAELREMAAARGSGR